jgi:XTP/dITP diphosphohydrolase
MAHLLTAIRKSGAAQPWSARFRCVLCYFDGKNTPWFVQGVCEGRILPEPVGTEGFGYDPLFWSEDIKDGFWLGNRRTKNPVSHRGRAIKAFQAE